jgi:hypothetical protein
VRKGVAVGCGLAVGFGETARLGVAVGEVGVAVASTARGPQAASKPSMKAMKTRKPL